MNKKILFVLIGAVILIIAGVLVYMTMKKAPPVVANTPQETTNASSTANQVQAQEVAIGTGAEAVPGATVSVLYVGQFPDGTVFDSSAMHENKPFTFVLGATEGPAPIAGFQIGINGMKVGGERVMSIPPALGYGEQEIKGTDGKVVIPANSTLVFNVKLVEVKAPANQ